MLASFYSSAFFVAPAQDDLQRFVLSPVWVPSPPLPPDATAYLPAPCICRIIVKALKAATVGRTCIERHSRDGWSFTRYSFSLPLLLMKNNKQAEPGKMRKTEKKIIIKHLKQTFSVNLTLAPFVVAIKICQAEGARPQHCNKNEKNFKISSLCGYNLVIICSLGVMITIYYFLSLGDF